MILVSPTYWFGPPFSFRRQPEGATVESLELCAGDFRRFRALYWRPERVPEPKLAVVAMHPRVDFTHHYTFPRLIDAGIACLGANTRNPNNDTDTVHEEILLDLGACVTHLRERGVRRVLLLGNSGGGSLAALYQSQAVRAAGDRIAREPGGKPTRLAAGEMIPADAMIFVAAHRGQGKVLGACIDPAVLDEADPLASDPALDMYDPRNGFRPPPTWSEYSDEFVTRFRAAQRARVARLDRRARALIDERREAVRAAREADRPAAEQRRLARAAAFEPVMTVYRTMANLHYTDRRLDPSPRAYGSLLSERPDLMNMQLLGFARTVTPRAWLSTWSALSSNADMLRTLPEITAPTLMVFAGSDKEIYPQTDVDPMWKAVAAADRMRVDIPAAPHYFEGEPGGGGSPHIAALMDAIVGWIRDRFEAS